MSTPGACPICGRATVPVPLGLDQPPKTIRYICPAPVTEHQAYEVDVNEQPGEADG